MKQSINGFERTITFTPAWDKRSDDPSRNYGVHGVNMLWYLKGEKGVIQFVTYTNWHLPPVEKELREIPPKRIGGDYYYWQMRPMPADLGYHAYEPQYESQTAMSEICALLEDKPCYYDGSGLAAQELFRVLVSEGEEAVWQYMEKYYNDLFHGER